MFLPLVIGAFLGGPLIARELETGSFRFAWTQSVGRTRWTIAKLVILGLALSVMALAFSAIFAWWYRPFEQLMGHATEVEGLVFAARLLFGFTLGAFVGAVVRRTVPAIAATMALWLAVVVPIAAFLRPHFEAPLIGRVDMAAKFGTEWSLSQWWVTPQVTVSATPPTTPSSAACPPPTRSRGYKSPVRSLGEFPARKPLLDLPDHRGVGALRARPRARRRHRVVGAQADELSHVPRVGRAAIIGCGAGDGWSATNRTLEVMRRAHKGRVACPKSLLAAGPRLATSEPTWTPPKITLVMSAG